MYFVYVIKAIERSRYTGMIEDLENRLAEHNNKELSFRTKRRTRWELLYKTHFYRMNKIPCGQTADINSA